MLGIHTLAVEVTHVSPHGLWLLLDHEGKSEELPLPFTHFPWFKNASIEAISHVERPSHNHLYWPDLDIDLSLASIREPANFPLLSKAMSHRKDH